jgi:hypothetical protein
MSDLKVHSDGAYDALIDFDNAVATASIDKRKINNSRGTASTDTMDVDNRAPPADGEKMDVDENLVSAPSPRPKTSKKLSSILDLPTEIIDQIGDSYLDDDGDFSDPITQSLFLGPDEIDESLKRILNFATAHENFATGHIREKTRALFHQSFPSPSEIDIFLANRIKLALTIPWLCSDITSLHLGEPRPKGWSKRARIDLKIEERKKTPGRLSKNLLKENPQADRKALFCEIGENICKLQDLQHLSFQLFQTLGTALGSLINRISCTNITHLDMKEWHIGDLHHIVSLIKRNLKLEIVRLFGGWDRVWQHVPKRQTDIWAGDGAPPNPKNPVYDDWEKLLHVLSQTPNFKLFVLGLPSLSKPQLKNYSLTITSFKDHQAALDLSKSFLMNAVTPKPWRRDACKYDENFMNVIPAKDLGWKGMARRFTMLVEKRGGRFWETDWLALEFAAKYFGRTECELKTEVKKTDPSRRTNGSSPMEIEDKELRQEHNRNASEGLDNHGFEEQPDRAMLDVQAEDSHVI